MVLSDKVDSSETLYRVVKRSRPDCITSKGNISPALFKDSSGISVDRDGGREEVEIIRFIKDKTFEKRAKAIVSIYAGFCFKIGAVVSPAPSDVNPYHANIYLDNSEKRRNLQALQLADNSKVVYNDGSMQWVVIPK